jgi:hypothetical protein
VFVLCYVGSGLCDKLITRSEESYRVCVCLIAFDIETATTRRLGPIGAVVLQENKSNIQMVSNAVESSGIKTHEAHPSN